MGSYPGFFIHGFSHLPCTFDGWVPILDFLYMVFLLCRFSTWVPNNYFIFQNTLQQFIIKKIINFWVMNECQELLWQVSATLNL
jgi:hypothetical protein